MRQKAELAICVVLLSTGCATTSTVEQTGFLRNYGLLQHGTYLDAVHTAPTFTPRRYSGVLVSVERGLQPSPEGLSVERLTQYLVLQVTSQLRETKLFSVVTDKTSEIPVDSNVLRCELAITRLDPGSRALRWWFSAGHSIVQVEGRLVDATTGQEMLTFAEKRRGVAFFDITGGDPEALIEQDLREFAEELVKQLLFS